MSVFWLWREIVLWWEIVLKMIRPFDFLWAVSTKKSNWVTLLWSASRCVYFERPNTLLLCIFLFWIFLLYCTDSQVELQIRILLKNKYVKSCLNANTGNHTIISCTQFLRKFLLGFFILLKQFQLGFFIKEKHFASKVVFLVKSKHWVLAEIRFYHVFVLFQQDFCSRVLFLANPDCVHGLFLVIL